MKIHYPLIMLFSLIVFSACKKKDAPLLTSVEGRWKPATPCSSKTETPTPAPLPTQKYIDKHLYKIKIAD